MLCYVLIQDSNIVQLIILTVVVVENRRVTSTLSVHGALRYVYKTATPHVHLQLTKSTGQRRLQDEVQEKQAYIPCSGPTAQPRQTQAEVVLCINTSLHRAVLYLAPPKRRVSVLQLYIIAWSHAACMRPLTMYQTLHHGSRRPRDRKRPLFNVFSHSRLTASAVLSYV